MQHAATGRAHGGCQSALKIDPFAWRLVPVVHRGTRAPRSARCEADAAARGGLDAKSSCRPLFDWYNEDHHHAGIGLMTPDQVRYGQADAVHAARQQTLDLAFRINPERFVNKAPERFGACRGGRWDSAIHCTGECVGDLALEPGHAPRRRRWFGDQLRAAVTYARR